MVRPAQLVDGADNVSPIRVFGMRQTVTKTATGPGNVSLDFTTADTTDPDTDGNTILMEPNQCYLAFISKTGNFFAQNIFNILPGLNSVFLANPYKSGILTGTLIYPFRLTENQNCIRFRMIAMLAADIVQVSVTKLS